MDKSNTDTTPEVQVENNNSSTPTTPLSSDNKVRIVQRRVQGKTNAVNASNGNSRPGNAGGYQGRPGGGRGGERPQREKSEFDVQIVSLGRVTKVTGGGKRMRMSVFVVIGDRKGNIGFGNGKGIDIKLAQEKAIDSAKRHMIKIKLRGTTIPHEMTVKYGAVKLWMKPAAPGTGIIAGGPVRKVLEVAGVKDILTKQLGTSNQVANAYATINALKSMKTNFKEKA